jgi:hypothetical protein
MEFVLVAHAIIVGLAVAEILRGLADTLRAETVRLSYRLLLIAGWALLLLWQLWWAIWRVGDRPEWTFPEYLIFLFPVAILYMIARLCFPEKVSGSDLQAYYLRVAGINGDSRFTGQPVPRACFSIICDNCDGGSSHLARLVERHRKLTGPTCCSCEFG